MGVISARGGLAFCPRISRSRGGLTTKIHALVDAKGLPARLSLTGGHAHDPPAADALLDRLRPGAILIADKASDADRLRGLIEGQGAEPNIPFKSNRRCKARFSKALYKGRNLIERFSSKLKHFRRIATRYDKLAGNFLAMVKLASVRLWLRAYRVYGLVIWHRNPNFELRWFGTLKRASSRPLSSLGHRTDG